MSVSKIGRHGKNVTIEFERQAEIILIRFPANKHPVN